MTTISANSSSGIVLTSPGYTNPVVVDAGVTITGALDGNGIAAYSRQLDDCEWWDR